MANAQDVELEAAKFLHKLIQESKDEPTKLATKLYVILQHMKSSGKENSRPYQVISRAMETVIKQHNLDIETLMSSCLPLPAGTQIGDSASLQKADEIYLYFKDTFGMASNANKPAQGSIPSSLSEAGMIRSVAPRDTGSEIFVLACHDVLCTDPHRREEC